MRWDGAAACAEACGECALVESYRDVIKYPAPFCTFTYRVQNTSHLCAILKICLLCALKSRVMCGGIGNEE